MSVAAGAHRAGKRLLRFLEEPYLAAAVMFLCFGLVAILTVQPRYKLGVPSPHSNYLTMGGFLNSAARFLGVSRLSTHGLTALYMVVLLVLYAAYVWMLIVLAGKGKRVGSAFIIGSSVAFCLWLLFIPPIIAKDLYNNAFCGRAISVYGKNPYVVVPRSFPLDPLTRFIGWKDIVSVYGPLFTYLSALTTLIAGKSVVSNILAFKLLGFAFFLGSLFLVDDLARRLVGDRRSFVLLAVAWNPLVLIHLVGGAHNDTIMVFLILLGFLLYRKERPVLAVVSVVLAVLIKITAVYVLIPMMVLFLRENAKRGIRQYLEAALAIIAIPLALYLPLWPGKSGFESILWVGSRYSGASVPRFFRGHLRAALQGLGMKAPAAWTASYGATRIVFLLLFLVLFVLLCYRVRDLRSLIFYSGVIMFAFLMTTTWLMPWYAGFLVILAALSGSYLWTGGAVAVTAVMCYFGPDINRLPQSLFPVLLLLIAAFMIVAIIRKGLHRSLKHGQISHPTIFS